MSKADGRDDGSVMGEMKGGMKNVESLYLKGSTPSDGRDGPLFVNTPSLSVNNASLISNNPDLFALNPILFCARCSLTEKYLFPAWEQYLPSLGIKHSLTGNILFPPWKHNKKTKIGEMGNLS